MISSNNTISSVFNLAKMSKKIEIILKKVKEYLRKKYYAELLFENANSIIKHHDEVLIIY